MTPSSSPPAETATTKPEAQGVDRRERLVVIILTLNEECNLPKALASIGDRAPALVVDSLSSDGTRTVAEAYGATFVENRFENYSKQRNFALRRVEDRFRWVLFLDADEEFTDAVWDEVDRVIDDDQVDGAYIGLDMRFLGYRIVHGEHTGSHKLSLMRPEKARYTRAINERVDDSEMRVVVLKNRLIHRDAKPLADWFHKHIRYAEKEARAFLENDVGRTLDGFQLRTKAGRTIGLRWAYNKMPLFVRPFVRTARAFVALGAWRDGLPGVMFTAMHSLWYPMVLDLFIYEEKLRRAGVLDREFAPRSPPPRRQQETEHSG